MMILKRKRSDSTISASSTATAALRDQSSSPCPEPFKFGYASYTTRPVHQTEPSRLHSRTRKRHRDNRPDEDTIYSKFDLLYFCLYFFPALPSSLDSPKLNCGRSPENTYHKLFAAARSPPIMTPSSSQDYTPPQPSQSPQHQHSLHTFWSISSPPIASDPIDIVPSPAPSCEDCEAPLDSSDNDASMSGIDEEDARGSGSACRCCGRRVCGICAVIEIGVGRECLQCRTSRRKKWVGGTS